jgi:oxygen-independent coproporphyrinogen-3 oxidase
MHSYAGALVRELGLWAQRLGPTPELASIYVGGGTPTLWPADLWEELEAALRRHFAFSPDLEFTVEGNPGTVDYGLLSALRKLGANRLSLGVQSFDPRFLALAGRPYGPEDIWAAVAAARSAGFANLSLDLIFGFPGQTLANWEKDLEAALALAPTHLSCYELELHPDTPWGRAEAEGRLARPEEEERAAMYEYAVERLAWAGFEQYEISNFARPGYACRHNLAYWLRRPYLGVGVAAASFIGERRWINVKTLDEYLARLSLGRLPVADVEELTPEAAMAETMFLGLRLTRGVDGATFRRRFGREITEVYGRQIAALAERGLLEERAGTYRLTEKGRLLGNLVFREFI